MLLEYSVRNYKSFKEEAFLDLRPAASKVTNRYPGNFNELPTKEKVLKSAVIVGENAGGKSNLVDSVAFLRSLMVRTDQHITSCGAAIHFSNQEEWDLRSSSPGLMQDFSVSIALDGHTYSYQVELAPWGIKSESLSVRNAKKGRDELVFHMARLPRDSCEECQENSCQKSLENNPLCLDTVLEYGAACSLEEADIRKMMESQDFTGSLGLVWLAAVGEDGCKNVLKWFSENLMAVSMDSRYSFISVTKATDLLKVMHDPRYMEIITLLDGSICNLEINSEHPLTESMLVRRDSVGREFRRQIQNDSTGLSAFLVWAYFIYKVLYEGKTVLADEVDGTINPMLSEKVIALINGTDCQGQFIFTTHNIFNLNLRTFMKEQIYFATKDPLTLESSLYSVADFPEIRYDKKQELYEYYFKGMLGGTVNG